MRIGDCKHCRKGFTQHEGKKCVGKSTEFTPCTEVEVLLMAIEENTEVAKQQLEVSKSINGNLSQMLSKFPAGDDIQKQSAKLVKLLEGTNNFLERFEDERNKRR